MRPLKLLVGLLSTLALVTGTLAFSACGSSDGEGEPSGTADAASEAALETDAAADGPTYDECVVACGAAHAKGKALVVALDTCWEQACPGTCSEFDGGFVPPDAGVADAGDAGDDGGDAGDGGDASAPLGCGGEDPIETGYAPCDLCTVSACCAPYNACELDSECAAYSTCAEACEALEEP
jgi:hypothetical protein